MSIVAAELLCYNCINRPTDDASTGGGTISDTGAAATANKGMRTNYTQWAAANKITFQSTSASDTQSCVIDGRDSTGAVSSETLVLTGVTEKASVNTYERILDFDLTTAVAVGTVTVREAVAGTTRFTIVIGEVGASALFKRSASQVGAVTRYDKFFWKNTNASLTLNAAAIVGVTDTTGLITQLGLAVALNDSVTIANRTTAPAGITFANFTVSQACVGNAIASGSAQGTWVKQALGASQGPNKNNFTTQLSGTTI